MATTAMVNARKHLAGDHAHAAAAGCALCPACPRCGGRGNVPALHAVADTIRCGRCEGTGSQRGGRG
jgi:hypothetical protein